METIDPATGQPLPPDALQRILFIASSVHIYNIPPLTSNKGYVASTWTADNNKRQIFTARIRILETAIPDKNGEDKVKADILLEDPSNGQLFAAAPYTVTEVVEQVLDSSRFFAVRVQGEGGRKAVLGIGFEERSEAFDFSVALQEVRKTLGIEEQGGGKPTSAGMKKESEKPEVKRDFSLKEGETITVNIGGRGAGRRTPRMSEESEKGVGGFSLPPPPVGASMGSFLPPPPSAQEVKAKKRLSQNNMEAPSLPEPSAEELGFDDGEFGEFQ
ncbi:9c6165d7-8629-4b62-973b-8483d24ce275 [Sclerotinia trifoliorum]|uniref:9c6165d7-8629-4b62-973b-8483d24ce275 n=1 Tax=Sclerotinia trifoliorum TaxID=28548 RepID=A0A8H2W273_9HELO|nr:9c6165d7-8629-4b62-973b-8483d24ce275 [Sclerotinia trifoliorum]